MEALLFLLAVVAVAVWRGWPKQKPAALQREVLSEQEPAKTESPMDGLDRWAIEHGQLLTDQINESIKVANDSKVVDTKFSRIGVARQKVAELRELAKQYPFLRLERADEVADTLNRIEYEAQQLRIATAKPADYPVAAVGMARSNVDLVKGLVFRATLQLRTPLDVLRRHGYEHLDLDSDPPCFANESGHGFWSPILKTWKELTGSDIPQFEPNTIASDIGALPDSGSAYLSFLVAVRSIYEDPALTDAQREAAIREELSHPIWAEFVDRHGGPDAVLVGLAGKKARAKRRKKLEGF